ncbi:hypothetical protein [Yinghuangia sp. YIM S09857]|uniref:hypothetical protein n=1 Tax=Yinghuangia sp. YIM S09857 TaxID=3436929 RepID=UPI003F536F0D
MNAVHGRGRLAAALSAVVAAVVGAAVLGWWLVTSDDNWRTQRPISERTLLGGIGAEPPTSSPSGRFDASRSFPVPFDESKRALVCVRVTDYHDRNAGVFANGPVQRFRDDHCFDDWRDQPISFWDAKQDKIWLLADRSSAPGNRPVVRVIGPNPQGKWSAQDLPPEQDATLPKEVRNAKPPEFWTRRTP